MVHDVAIARYEIIAFSFVFVDENTREVCNEFSFGTIRAVKSDFQGRLHRTFLEI